MQTETTGPRFGRLNRLSEERSKKQKSPSARKSTAAKTRTSAKRPTTPSEVRAQERQRIKDVFLSQEARDQPYTAAFLLVTTNSAADQVVSGIQHCSMSREDAIQAIKSATTPASKPKPFAAAAQSDSTDRHGWNAIHNNIQQQKGN